MVIFAIIIHFVTNPLYIEDGNLLKEGYRLHPLEGNLFQKGYLLSSGQLIQLPHP